MHRPFLADDLQQHLVVVRQNLVRLPHAASVTDQEADGERYGGGEREVQPIPPRMT